MVESWIAQKHPQALTEIIIPIATVMTLNPLEKVIAPMNTILVEEVNHMEADTQLVHTDATAKRTTTDETTTIAQDPMKIVEMIVDTKVIDVDMMIMMNSAEQDVKNREILQGLLLMPTLTAIAIMRQENHILRLLGVTMDTEITEDREKDFLK